MTKKQEIVSIQQEGDCVVFNFVSSWYQEDIMSLSTKIFESLPTIKIIEKIEGADRVNIRFLWLEKYCFSLNFDYYSQSCWVEGEDDSSKMQLNKLTIGC